MNERDWWIKEKQLQKQVCMLQRVGTLSEWSTCPPTSPPILVLLHVSYCLKITCRQVIVYRGHRQNAGATYDGLYGGEHELGINKVCVADLLSPLELSQEAAVPDLSTNRAVTDFPRE